MNRKVNAKVRSLSDRRRRKNVMARVAAVMSCIAIFTITYVLVSPARTVEWPPLCGKEEHTHTEDCYEQVAVFTREYVCEYDSLDNLPEGVTIEHVHNEYCYDYAGNLICGLPAMDEVSGSNEVYDASPDETEPEVVDEPESSGEEEPEAEDNTEASGEEEPEPEVEDNTEASGEEEPEPEVEDNTEASGEEEPEPEVEDNTEANGEEEPEAEAEDNTEANGEEEPEPEVEDNTEANGEEEPEPEAEDNTEASGEEEPEPEAENNTEANGEIEPEINAEDKFEIAFEFDENDKPILTGEDGDRYSVNEDGEIVDKNGKVVENAIIKDGDGNELIIDEDGELVNTDNDEVVLDREEIKQLLPEEDKFELTFEFDENDKPILTGEDGNRYGVNENGEIVDENGEVAENTIIKDKDGNELIIDEDGELVNADNNEVVLDLEGIKQLLPEQEEEPETVVIFHVHTAECVHDEMVLDEDGNQVYETVLTCGLEEHVHTDLCHLDSDKYSCGKVVHTHDETCYDEEGNLICGLEEHQHTESCVREEYAAYYCMKVEHIHDETCYDAEGNLICDLEEHQHTELCLDPNYGTYEEDYSEEISYTGDDGLAVTVKVKPSAFDKYGLTIEDVTLAAKLLEGDEYDQVGAELNSDGVEYDDYIALDISFLKKEAVAEPDDTATGTVDATLETYSASPEPDDTTPEPDTEVTEPDDTTPEPDTEAAEPDDTTPEPNTEVTEPDDTTPEPDTEAAEPNDTTSELDTEAAEPDNTTPEPDTEAAEPDDEAAELEEVTTAESGTVLEPDGGAVIANLVIPTAEKSIPEDATVDLLHHVTNSDGETEKVESLLNPDAELSSVEVTKETDMNSLEITETVTISEVPVESFSTFTITWVAGVSNNIASGLYSKVTWTVEDTVYTANLHYVNTSGIEICTPRKGTLSLTLEESSDSPWEMSTLGTDESNVLASLENDYSLDSEKSYIKWAASNGSTEQKGIVTCITTDRECKFINKNEEAENLPDSEVKTIDCYLVYNYKDNETDTHTATLHFMDEDGNELQGTKKLDLSVGLVLESGTSDDTSNTVNLTAEETKTANGFQSYQILMIEAMDADGNPLYGKYRKYTLSTADSYVYKDNDAENGKITNVGDIRYVDGKGWGYFYVPDSTVESAEDEPQSSVWVPDEDTAGVYDKWFTYSDSGLTDDTNVDVYLVYEDTGDVVDEGNYDAYVTALNVSSILDGTPSFNTSEEGEGDGKDSGDSNGIVRTFDTITYKVEASFGSISSVKKTTGTIYLSAEMPYGPTEAQFNTNSLKYTNGYQIEYWGAEKVLYVVPSGLDEGYMYEVEEWNEDGSFSKLKDTPTDLNALANGSGAGSDSYKIPAITKQKLVLWYDKISNDANVNVFDGSQQLEFGISVLNKKNQSTVEPTVKVWVAGNENNYNNNYGMGTGINTITFDGVYGTNSNYAVKVTCAMLYNVELKKSSYLSYLGWFDFSTGKQITSSSNGDLYKLLEVLGKREENQGECDPTKYVYETDGTKINTGTVNVDGIGEVNLDTFHEAVKNVRYGRLIGYGVDVQLSNTDSKGTYGKKGLALPDGDITIDMNLTQAGFEGKGTEEIDKENYYTVLWDYDENIRPGEDSGELGKNMYWKNDGFTKSGYAVVPLNSIGTNVSTYISCSCYEGGNWELAGTKTRTTELTTGYGTGDIIGNKTTADDTIYTFKISGYDFDLDDYTFPVWTWPGNDSYTAAYRDYDYVFSAGYVETLSVFPRCEQGGVAVTLQTKTTVGNLSIRSNLASDSSEAKTLSRPTDSSTTIDYSYETNTGYKTDSVAKDNQITVGITLTSTGSWTRREQVMRRGALTATDTTDVLSSYWQTNDASLYTGGKFNMASSVYLNSVSEYTVTAMDYLQIFDTTSFLLDVDDSSSSNNDKVSATLRSSGNPSCYGGGSGKTIESTTKNSDGKSVVSAKVNILYAGDPNAAGGYNTNDGVDTYTICSDGTSYSGLNRVQYMNLVRAENLVYAKSVEYKWVDANGTVFDEEQNSDGTLQKKACIKFGDSSYLVCIGVMAEFRNVVGFERGCYFFNVSIPMRVADANVADVGETASAVNCETVWCYNEDFTSEDDKQAITTGLSNVSWLNAKWDNENGINVPEDGYVGPVKVTNENNQTTITNQVSYFGTGVWLQLANTKDGFSKYVYDENGKYKSGTESNTTSGTCALIKSYEAEVVINSNKKDGSKQYNLAHESGEVEYTIFPTTKIEDDEAAKLTSQPTDLTITVDFSGITGESGGNVALTDDKLDVQWLTTTTEKGNPPYTIQNYETGNLNITNSEIGNSEDAAAKYEWTYYDGSDTITKTAKIWYELNGKTLIFHLENVPSKSDETEKYNIPEIVAHAKLGGTLGNGYTITATASIIGTADKSAYTDDDMVTIINLSGGSFGKQVDEPLIELNGTIHYRLSYESKSSGTNNSSNTSSVADLYIYDILPDNTDGRGTNIKGTTSLDSVSAEFSNGANSYDSITYYYSTENVTTLNTAFKELRDNSSKSTDDIEGILSSYFSTNGVYNEYSSDLSSKEKERITCILAYIKDFSMDSTVTITLTMGTSGNQAEDLYVNDAYVRKIQGTDIADVYASKVETRVVSRSISGLVWFDGNLNGKYDTTDGGMVSSDESLLEGITCTLFKLNETTNTYEKCTTTVYGGDLFGTTNTTSDTPTVSTVKGSVTTDGTGTYKFEKLAAGKYVVAFSLPSGYSGNINGATTYQVNGGNDTNTNDAVALSSTESGLDTENITFSGIDYDVVGTTGKYQYAIAYDLTNHYMTGNTLTELGTGKGKDANGNDVSITINAYSNYQQNYVNQDCGLVYATAVLPSTGGPGTTTMTVIGIALLAVAAGLAVYVRQTKKKERHNK